MMLAAQLFLFVLVLLGSASSSVGLGSSGVLLAGLASEDEDVVKLAIANSGAEALNHRGQGGQTPLMASVLSGRTLAVKHLLQSSDVDVSIAENDGYTPMHGAGFQGRAEIAKLLIDHGLPLSPVHKDGFVPFHRACWGAEKRHTSTVKAFLQAGVDSELKAENGKKCADMTQNKGTLKLLQQWKAKKEKKKVGASSTESSGESKAEAGTREDL